MTNDLKTYDLVVMGGGPAGVTAATVASSFGKSVALVDSHQEIGGAGINTGTVPSKTLRETALALSGLKSRNLYGVDLSLRREVTVADFLGHEEHEGRFSRGHHAEVAGAQGDDLLRDFHIPRRAYDPGQSGFGRSGERSFRPRRGDPVAL
jgi:pyruvate/2-oxoglutarate dehydrogenase complex dihydrolipoamide dehydrogenase (E3) component